MYGHPAGDTVRDRVVVGGLVLSLLLVFAPSVYLAAADSKLESAAQETERIAQAMIRFHDDNRRWPVEGDGDTSTDEVRCLATRDGRWPDLAPGVSGWGSQAPQDDFENHLKRNRPFGIRGLSYQETTEQSWRGPYSSEFRADPWGRKYVSNVWNGHRTRSGPLWVISAGPNGLIDTRPSSRVVAGDDVGALVRH